MAKCFVPRSLFPGDSMKALRVSFVVEMPERERPSVLACVKFDSGKVATVERKPPTDRELSRAVAKVVEWHVLDWINAERDA